MKDEKFFESQVGTIGDRERRKRKSKDGKGKRLKFREDRSKRQSGKTDEKPAKRREIECSVFLELCIVLRDRQREGKGINEFRNRIGEETSTHLENCTGRVRKDTMEKNQK